MNDPFPVSESLLCYFVASLARQGLTPTTIQTYLAAVFHAQIIGVSVSEPLPSDVNVDLVCLSVMDRRTAYVRHGNGACISFFARGSVCYYGYSLSSEHR